MTRRVTLATVAAIAALLLSAGLAAAQDPPETATATRLEPGFNLVGWVGEPTPVSQLFQQIPRLEAIWAWDAELRDWIVAAPGAPEWLGGLGRVTAGMGLRMQLGGDQPYLWERSTEPTRGLVKLRTGWNLVAWGGADGAAIGDVVKGIGWSLRTVRRWDAANQQWVSWTSPERSAQVIANTGADQGDANDDEMPGIRRGEALWIEVARAVNWLQPTDVLPRLVFPGGASDELQAHVREDLRATLSFFRDQYGIQADPDFTIYVAKDVDALIQAWKDDGQESDDSRAAFIRDWWSGGSAGWVSAGRVDDTGLTLKQSLWESGTSGNPRYTLTHEYTHVLHGSLADGGSVVWLLEGTAEWAANAHRIADQSRVDNQLQTWRELRKSQRSRLTSSASTLRRTEGENSFWEYTLGWLAIDGLTTEHGRDSWLEFYRHITPTQIGPEGQWQSVPSWRNAFHDTFGLTVPEFYADFNAWQYGEVLANESRMSPNDAAAQWLFGSVTDASGSPIGGVEVHANRFEGGSYTGWLISAGTAADGTFALGVPQGGEYEIWVAINDNCAWYYSNGALVEQSDDASHINVAGADVTNIDIQLPLNACGQQIRGRVVGPNTEPLAGIPVTAHPAGGGRPRSDISGINGSFAITVDTSVEYRIEADLGRGCRVYFRTGAPASTLNDASLVAVADAHVSDLLVRMPEGMCVYQINGSITRADGEPLGAPAAVSACLEIDGACVASGGELTGDDGTFSVTVPTDGRYSLRFEFDSCPVYFGSGGFTTDWQKRSTTPVEGRNVRLHHLQIPAEMCAHGISGLLLKADGTPLVYRWMSAYGLTSGFPHHDTTDANGRFEVVRVPSDGTYRIGVSLREAPSCFYLFAGQSLGSPDNPVRVSGADVTGVVLRLPGTIEELCE